VNLDDTLQVWSEIADRVETFSSSWDGGETIPSLTSLLPAEPLLLRQLVLNELIKIDLTQRWQRNVSRTLEEYFDEYRDTFDGPFPCELVYEEFRIRKQLGHDVSVEQYVQRFPEHEKRLRRLLEADDGETTFCVQPQKAYAEIDVDQTLDDFDLLAVLGEGAFGRVFLARQRSMQRLVALKVSADHGNEPQTLAQLDHPNIVRVFDQRQLSDRNLRLLYMQYLAGGTLLDAMRRVHGKEVSVRTGQDYLAAVDNALIKRGEEPPAESGLRKSLADADWVSVVCQLGSRLADALDYASQRGVLHRDVKPANILIAADASPKLADFNTSFNAKLEGSAPAAYFGGSLAYMSPEQLEACDAQHPRQPDSLDSRSDLYSLAVVLWEFLYAQRPFDDSIGEAGWATTLGAMVDRRRQMSVQDPNAVFNGPRAEQLKQTLLTALNPDPNLRFASGRQFAWQLELALKPEALALISPAAKSWRGRLRHFPFLMFFLGVLVPNALAAVFNLVYNQQEIVSKLQGAQEAFWRIQSTINSIAFPLGIIILGVMFRPIWQRMRKLQGAAAEDEFIKVEALDSEDSLAVRKRSLQMARLAAGVSLTLWLVAGIAYPLSLRYSMGEVPANASIHFFASLALCGIIAAAYPYLLTMFFAIELYYPAFLQFDDVTREEQGLLDSASRWNSVFLGVAAIVPMLAIAILVGLGSENRLALGVMSTAGLIGFLLLLVVERIMQRDIKALRE
jgi:serine/threonine protein kinase